MFILYLKDRWIMALDYKPVVGDVIRDDASGVWYEVLRLDGRKAFSRTTVDPRS